MGILDRHLDFDTAWDADPMDAWATITLIVVATVVSVQRFMGIDNGFLVGEIGDLPWRGWTLFTTTLLHGSWLHLLFNLYWTYKFGVLLEAVFGTVAFSVIVVALATGSSAAQLALSGPGIGLSGIGYGMFGLLWALDRWHPRCRGLLDRRIAELFAAWFLLCLLATWFDVMPIANTAHGAGFLVGALFGWTLGAQGTRRLLRGSSLLGFALILPILFLPPVRHVLNRSQAYSSELFTQGYDALMEEDWEAARRHYEAFVAREPDVSEGWNNLGIAYIELGQADEAREAIARSEKLESERNARTEEEKPSFNLFSSDR